MTTATAPEVAPRERLALAEASHTEAVAAALAAARAVQKATAALAEARKADAERDPKAARTAALLGRPPPPSKRTEALARELADAEDVSTSAQATATAAAAEVSAALVAVGNLERREWQIEAGAASARLMRAFGECVASAAALNALQRDRRAPARCRAWNDNLANTEDYWSGQAKNLGARLRELEIDLEPERPQLTRDVRASLRLNRNVYRDAAGALFADDYGRLPLDLTSAEVREQAREDAKDPSSSPVPVPTLVSGNGAARAGRPQPLESGR